MELKSLQRMKRRIGYYGEVEKNDTDTKVETLVKADQWTRMREDKLRSLKKALFYSYQAAVVQQYDAEKNSFNQEVISIISTLQVKEELSESQLSFLQEEIYPLHPELERYDIYDDIYIEVLTQVLGESEFPKFRCLINHDKLKVDYEDKIISIPFAQKQYEKEHDREAKVLQTNFHNGTVFKWLHGNKEEWVPDTYWIVYMQYSEETAYFRGEIRRADEEILIIDADGNTLKYHGWMTGPDERTALWNVKKNIVWNDLNYTKLLYITRDSNTLAFFKRFDKIAIWNSAKNQYDYWQVQAYNDNYGSSSSNIDTGLIRVALKETYTDADKVVEKIITEKEEEESAEKLDAVINGKSTVYPYDLVTYTVVNPDYGEWAISDTSLASIESISQDGMSVNVYIKTNKSSTKGFDITYGNLSLHVTIASL